MGDSEAVPFCKRGLYLHQLQSLTAACIDSGWLDRLCRDFNAQQALSGREKTPNMYALCEFWVQPVTDPSSFHTLQTDICIAAGISSPSTKQCSYAELVNHDGIELDIMVSHYWGHLFKDTIKSLSLFAEMSFTGLQKEHSLNVSFWICLFALNQHEVQVEVGASPEDGPFNEAIIAAKSTVMVLDSEVQPLRRIWCLYEVQRSHELGTELQLLTKQGLLCERNRTCEKNMENVMDAIANLSAFDALASVEEDKLAIWYRIANSFVRDIHTYQKFKHLRASRNWFEQFDIHTTQLLAQPLFKLVLDKSDAHSAIRYLGLGASCTAADLQKIEALGGQLKEPIRTRFSERCSLVHATAYFGCADALNYLLRAKHSPTSIDSRGLTPLHHAARAGHIEAAKLLLEHHASPTARNSNGCTPLHRAAYASHAEVVHLLLQNAADANAIDSDGWSPVLAAAIRGHENVIAVFLKHGFSERTRRHAIQAAKEHWHSSVAELLSRSTLEGNSQPLLEVVERQDALLERGISQLLQLLEKQTDGYIAVEDLSYLLDKLEMPLEATQIKDVVEALGGGNKISTCSFVSWLFSDKALVSR